MVERSGWKTRYALETWVSLLWLATDFTSSKWYDLLGGIYFFLYRHGWALDNVQSIEVVLAEDGSIVRTSPPTASSIMRFGAAGLVLTLVWLQNLNWASIPTKAGVSIRKGDAVIDAFIEYGNNNPSNPDASAWRGQLRGPIYMTCWFQPSQFDTTRK